MHIELSRPLTEDKFNNYLKTDLEGRLPSQVRDLYFVLQQCTLDSLFAALQAEVSILS